MSFAQKRSRRGNYWPERGKKIHNSFLLFYVKQILGVFMRRGVMRRWTFCCCCAMSCTRTTHVYMRVVHVIITTTVMIITISNRTSFGRPAGCDATYLRWAGNNWPSVSFYSTIGRSSSAGTASGRALTTTTTTTSERKIVRAIESKRFLRKKTNKR